MARARLMHLVVGAIQLSRWPDCPRMIPRCLPDCTTLNDDGMNPASSSFCWMYLSVALRIRMTTVLARLSFKPDARVP
eukprot:8795028-Pyramimonas_sp.AAC.1